jgi:hypothetical protein
MHVFLSTCLMDEKNSRPFFVAPNSLDLMACAALFVAQNQDCVYVPAEA